LLKTTAGFGENHRWFQSGSHVVLSEITRGFGSGLCRSGLVAFHSITYFVESCFFHSRQDAFAGPVICTNLVNRQIPPKA
ncbi:MAG: hypothetical protein ACOCUV_02080, partial [bacterium]